MDLLGFFGRTRAFETKLAQSRPRLYRLARAWCGNRAVADDLVQETLSKALTRAGQLRDAEAFHGWLLAIMANCCKDHYRRGRDAEDIDELADHLAADDGTPEDDYEQNQIVRCVRQAVQQLPVGQRQVVTLVDLEECAYAEVAAILEIPIGTVMSRLSRARLALREMLAEFQGSATANGSQGRLARVK
ncbi:MAG TPA: RNA polymerase sigma factor [Rhodocyclaceae bacterium]|nr:RNA polymerase sigma factor [Rhodocyclaceae bacterium]